MAMTVIISFGIGGRVRFYVPGTALAWLFPSRLLRGADIFLAEQYPDLLRSLNGVPLKPYT